MRSPHLQYLHKCLALAEQAPSLPTNFRVGALLVSRKDGDIMTAQDETLATGYTMELPGNTHAEQCLLSKYASEHSVPDERVSEVLPDTPDRKLVLYVTMEPCGKRLSGNLPCVQRVIQTRQNGRRGIEKVYFGVKEPTTFVGESEGCRMLTEAGIEWRVVQGLEKEILTVATAGHENSEAEVKEALSKVETNLDDISDDEARRQDLLKRNPKKRVMEGIVPR
ncbi:hypothetical protein BDW74DRAFT_145141 [Aspergillus multicolor]|uniref:putative DRAP deaminase n=1 Tax=Aspergillus multicolor TaxID=41759 RepID=UPI003CCE049A